MTLIEAIDKLIPKKLAEEILGLLENLRGEIETRLGSNVKFRKLDEFKSTKHFTGIFVDGSNSITERRGAGLATISVAALLFSFGANKYDFHGKYLLTPDKSIVFLVPRFYVGTRANNIMKAMEYYVSAYMINQHKERGDVPIDAVILDGSFASALLSPRWGIEHLYSDFRDIYGAPQNEIVQLCNRLSEKTHEFMGNLFGEGTKSPEKIINEFVNEYPRIFSEIYETLTAEFEINSDAEIPLLNYTAFFLETNFMMYALDQLLKKATKTNTIILWVNKEPESRIIARKLKGKVLSIFTDATILDYALEEGDILIFTGAPKIDPKRMYITNQQKKVSPSAAHVLIPQLANSIYETHGKYNLIYVKYRDYVIQISYPQKMEELRPQKEILELIEALKHISPGGYPHPLQQAHNTTIIRETLAQIMADAILTRITKKDPQNIIIKLLLSERGRKLAGI